MLGGGLGVPVYVDAGLATGGNDGTSWADAYQDLNLALFNYSPGDEFRLAQGLYLPSDSGDRDASFFIGDNVDDLTILGGYRGNDGSGLDADDRDIAAFPTILSGDLAGDDDQGSIGDNSRHIVIIELPGGDITFDGLTIIGGHADTEFGVPINPDRGAGVNAVLNFTDLALRDVVLEKNIAQTPLGGSGAAIAVQFANLLEMDQCALSNNLSNAEGGAALITEGSALFKSCVLTDNEVTSSTGTGGAVALRTIESVQIDGCQFVSNLSAGGAGAIGASGVDLMVIADSQFRLNTALGSVGDGGAIHSSGNLEILDIQSSTFAFNSANRNGGAVRFDNDSSGLCTISGCSFSNNMADVAEGAGGALDISSNLTTITDSEFVANECGSQGGAIRTADSGLNISNCIFEANKALANALEDLGGGAVHISSATIEISDCHFSDNEADSGGAVWVIKSQFSAMTMDRCLLTRNKARSGEGGALWATAVDLNLINCVFSENEAHATEQGETADGGGAYVRNVGPSRPLQVVNCTFADNTAEDEAGGLWTDAINGDSGLEIVNSIFFLNRRNSTVNPPDQSEPAQIHVNESNPDFPGITVAYCDIQNLITLNTVPGTNINISPNFAGGQPLGTRRVQRLSEVLDAGDGPTAELFFNPAQTPGLSFFDVAGYERYVDDPTKSATGIPRTQDDPTVVIDMGAHERFQNCPGDLNDDCTVNTLDLGLVLGNFQTTGGTEWGPGDANGDGDVNGMDLNLVVGNFGEVCECDGQFAPVQGESGSGSQQAAAMAMPLGAPNESSASSGESTAEPIESDLPTYLLYLGWTSEADYALWLSGLSEQDRLIHMIELVQAYEAVGE